MKVFDKVILKVQDKVLSKDMNFKQGSVSPGTSYWERVDGTDILRVDGTQIEVIE